MHIVAYTFEGEKKTNNKSRLCMFLNISFWFPFLSRFIAYIFKMFVIDAKFADFTVSNV